MRCRNLAGRSVRYRCRGVDAGFVFDRMLFPVARITFAAGVLVVCFSLFFKLVLEHNLDLSGVVQYTI